MTGPILLRFAFKEEMEENTTELKINNTRTQVSREQITVSEAGRRGGKATLRNQGPDFFKNIGKRGGKRTAKLYGHLMRERGKRGGRPKRPAVSKLIQCSDDKSWHDG